MASTKVINADLFAKKMFDLQNRTWSYGFSPVMVHGIDSLSAFAIQNALLQAMQAVERRFEGSLRELLFEIQKAVEECTIDDRENLCGLCRPPENRTE